MVAKKCRIRNISIHNSFNLLSKALIFSIIYLITIPHLSWAKYTYSEILPPGWNEAKAFDINDNGELVGYGSTANNNFMGFLYRNGTYTEVSPPGWQLLEIYGINNSGEVVGRVLYKDGNMNGFMFDSSSYFTLLPYGWKWSQTYAINDNGDVIGVGSSVSGYRGFIATGTPDINVNPLAIFFGGNIKAGIVLDQTVIVKNAGKGKLVIGVVTAPSFPFSKSTDNCSGQTLAPFATCKIIYSLILTSGEKMVVSTSDIPSNDPNKKSVPVTLGLFPDNDRDGYTLDVDCNDSDPSVNPGVTEIPNNNRDDDCNELTRDVSNSIR